MKACRSTPAPSARWYRRHMGRIADAAILMLAAGPAPLSDLSAALRARGVTRAKDPLASVRRALRNDPRIIETRDGTVARIDRTLAGVRLTARVTADARSAGWIDAVDDLAPLRLLGLFGVTLPADAQVGDLVVIGVEDSESGEPTVQRVPAPVASQPDDEAALVGEVGARLAQDFTRGSIGHLPSLFAAVAADGRRFRSPGRPIGEILSESGWEASLGWVGPAGTRWADVAREEADALEADIVGLLLDDRIETAVAVQHRLLTVLRRHLPERVPAARRRLARMLARGGRVDDARQLLEGAFAFEDPEDRYEAAVLALRTGDTARARRLVEEGLARAHGTEVGDVRICLEDIAGDLDAQATFARSLEVLQRDAPRAADIAAAVVAPRRSYLVEMVVDRVFRNASPIDAHRLIDEFAIVEGPGRDACHACAATLPPPLGAHADDAAGDAPARRPWVRGLIDAVPRAAWSTSPSGTAPQEHLIVTIEKEAGRVASLVVLVDHDRLDGAVRDVFFLPDIAEPRFEREVLAPLEESGVHCAPIPLELGLSRVETAVLATDPASGAIEEQVWERITRWVVPPGDPA